ncbi:elicitor-responsive protein 3-like isoform X2 [Pyrus communis]|uniref:elicitor-responsive protein 3-like isoform X2 n=1 Tax=Pyrus communis TaxID=23211 RepID=UPI0035C09D6E
MPRALKTQSFLAIWILMSSSPARNSRRRARSQQFYVCAAQGSNPEWNESFVFGVADGVTELHLMIMDKDTGSADDFVGELSIPLRTIYEEGKLPPMKYNVLRNKKYRGEIKIGFTFTPAVTNDRELEFVGGWKESSY